jgi:hypothetical protein
MPSIVILAARVEDHKLIVDREALPQNAIQDASLPRNAGTVLL